MTWLICDGCITAFTYLVSLCYTCISSNKYNERPNLMYLTSKMYLKEQNSLIHLALKRHMYTLINLSIPRPTEYLTKQ